MPILSIQEASKKCQVQSYQIQNNFNCPLCEYKTDRKYYLQAHVLAFHQSEIFPCPICEREFTQKAHLLLHMKSGHMQSVPVEDAHMSLSSEVTENEKEEVTVVGKISDTASMYYCHVCGKTFGRETNFRIHMNTHPNPCPHCGKAFKQKTGLQAHISSVHEGQKFQCPHCEYKATCKGSLQTHIT